MALPPSSQPLAIDREADRASVEYTTRIAAFAETLPLSKRERMEVEAAKAYAHKKLHRLTDNWRRAETRYNEYEQAGA